jgi:hypothetical protein
MMRIDLQKFADKGWTVEINKGSHIDIYPASDHGYELDDDVMLSIRQNLALLDIDAVTREVIAHNLNRDLQRALILSLVDD